MLADTDTVYDPYDALGLVMQGQYRDIHSKFYSGQANLSVAQQVKTGKGAAMLRDMICRAWTESAVKPIPLTPSRLDRANPAYDPETGSGPPQTAA